MTRTTVAASTVAAALTGLMALTPSAALAAPPTDGCPRGWLVWDVLAEPYQMDDAVDEDGDGWVCARALGTGWSTRLGTTLTIYLFGDDTLQVGAS